MDRIHQSGDNRLWISPKTAAIAERLWSPAEQTAGIENMYSRLDTISHRLDFRGALHNRNYEPMLRAPRAPSPSRCYKR